MRRRGCGVFLYSLPDPASERNESPVLTADQYRAVFEASPDGLVIVDSQGVIRDVNPQVEALFGWAREELLGETVEMLVPEAMRATHHRHRERYARNPHTRPMGVGLELRGRRKDGSEFDAEISLSPWRSEGESNVICTVRDITERKRLQDFSAGAMRASEDERQRIARELHDDTAQRLATLLLRVRVLALEKDPVVRAERLDELREEILETAEGVKRIARNLRPPELEEVGLGTAIQAHLRSVREASGLDVEADIGPVDPFLAPDARLALYRVVQEALSNVIRHSGAARARLRLSLENGLVSAVIEDDGRGFSEGRVTERGSGLGLVGMRERASMIGGRVTIESTPGEGTRIRIDVPAEATEKQNA